MWKTFFLKLINSFSSAVSGSVKSIGPVAANSGAKLSHGFLDVFSKRLGAYSLGIKAGKAVQSMVWSAIHDTAYKYGKKTFGTRLASLFSGASAQSAISAGNALSVYGGSAESFIQTMTSLTNKLGGLNYGEAGFLKTIMMRSNGMMNIFGSGRNGFATPQELLDNFAEIGKYLDAADFNAIADALGVDVATRKIIRDGEYELLKSRVTLFNSDVKAQEALGKQEAKTVAEWERMSNLWASKTAPFWEGWERFKGNLWESLALSMQADKLSQDKEAVNEFKETKEEQIVKVLNGNSPWNTKEVNAYLPAIASKWLELGGDEKQIVNIAKAAGVDLLQLNQSREFFARMLSYKASRGDLDVSKMLSQSDVERNNEAYILAFKNKYKESQVKDVIDEQKRIEQELEEIKSEEARLTKEYNIHERAGIREKRTAYYSPMGGVMMGGRPVAYQYDISDEEQRRRQEGRFKRRKELSELRKKKEGELEAHKKENSWYYFPEGTKDSDGEKGGKGDNGDEETKGKKTTTAPQLSFAPPIVPRIMEFEPRIPSMAVTKDVAASHIENNYSPQIHVAMDIHAEGKTANEIAKIGPQRIEEMYSSLDRQHMDFIAAKNVG